MGLAIEFAGKCRLAAQSQGVVAVLTLEAGLVIGLAFCSNTLHRVSSFATYLTLGGA